MAGTGAIWRDNNVEGSSSDKIEFDTGATPDALTKLGNTNVTILSGLAFLKKPKGQINRIQDTFTKGITYNLIGYVTSPKTALAMNKTKVWGMEAKTITSTFPFGRFGLRLDDFPDFNVRQNTHRGIMVGDIKWTLIADSKFKAAFEVEMYFHADATGINASTYNWNTT